MDINGRANHMARLIMINYMQVNFFGWSDGIKSDNTNLIIHGYKFDNEECID